MTLEITKLTPVTLKQGQGHSHAVPHEYCIRRFTTPNLVGLACSYQSYCNYITYSIKLTKLRPVTLKQGQGHPWASHLRSLHEKISQQIWKGYLLFFISYHDDKNLTKSTAVTLKWGQGHPNAIPSKVFTRSINTPNLKGLPSFLLTLSRWQGSDRISLPWPWNKVKVTHRQSHPRSLYEWPTHHIWKG